METDAELEADESFQSLIPVEYNPSYESQPLALTSPFIRMVLHSVMPSTFPPDPI